MRKNNLIIAVLAVALCTLITSAGMIDLGGPSAKKSHVLSDLHGVYVNVIIQNAKELAKYHSSLTGQHLRTKVESMLRQRHIKVLSRDELNSVPSKTILQVEVFSAIDKKLGAAAISVRLRLLEDINLTRNNSAKARAETWALSAAVLTNFEELEIVGEVVEKLTNPFCDRYDEANPRPGIYVQDKKNKSQKDAKKNPQE